MSLARRPLCSAGSPGEGSPTSSLLSGAPTSHRPSRRTSFPSFGGTVASSSTWPRAAWTITARRSGGFVSPAPLRQPAVHDGDDGISQVPGESTDPCHRSLTPVERQRQASRRLTCCLPHYPRRRPPRGYSFRGSMTAAYVLAVYASQRGSPHDHARLASGRRPALPGQDRPAGLRQEVSGSTFLPPPPGLAWRTGDRVLAPGPHGRSPGVRDAGRSGQVAEAEVLRRDAGCQWR